MTVKEAAVAIGVSPSKVYELAASGELPCYRVGARVVTEPCATISFGCRLCGRRSFPPRKASRSGRRSTTERAADAASGG